MKIPLPKAKLWAGNEMADLKKAFGLRLRELRKKLGYTQQQMAYALGIQCPRYGKYEIGAAEPPFEILTRLARLTNVSLDYLITGQSGDRSWKSETSSRPAHNLLEMLPSPALLIDKNGRLIDCNHRYLEMFFPDQPDIAQPGTPLEVLAHAWGNNQGFEPEEIEAYVQARRNRDLFRDTSKPITIGSKTLLISEAGTPDLRFVEITDVSEFRSLH